MRIHHSVSRKGVPLEGKELLSLIRRNPGKSAAQLAKMSGYTSMSKTGETRIKMLAFQNAVLAARNIRFKDTPLESEKAGRKASYRIQVQKNGSLLINSAYTRRMGIKPGTEFEVHIGHRQIKLIKVERSRKFNIHELLSKEANQLDHQELKYLIGYTTSPAEDERFHELLNLQQSGTLSDDEKAELKKQMAFYNLGMQKKGEALIELRRREYAQAAAL